MPPVKRKLDFGASEKEEMVIDDFLRRELERVYRESSEYWGFDFVNDKPIDGGDRWLWTRVVQGEVPEAYGSVCASVSGQLDGLRLREDQEVAKQSAQSALLLCPLLKSPKKLSQMILTNMLPSVKNPSQVKKRSGSPQGSTTDCPATDITKGVNSWMLPSSPTFPVRT